jgi:hypothetical protein
MERTKKRREKPRLEVLEFLFKLGTPGRREESAKCIKHSESETYYNWLQDSYHILKD